MYVNGLCKPLLHPFNLIQTNFNQWFIVLASISSSSPCFLCSQIAFQTISTTFSVTFFFKIACNNFTNSFLLTMPLWSKSSLINMLFNLASVFTLRRSFSLIFSTFANSSWLSLRVEDKTVAVEFGAASSFFCLTFSRSRIGLYAWHPRAAPYAQNTQINKCVSGPFTEEIAREIASPGRSTVRPVASFPPPLSPDISTDGWLRPSSRKRGS